MLLLSEPTRGVDVGAKAEIYSLIDGLVAAGMAVLLQSSELPEILRLANRCIVFAGGRPQGELAGPELNQAAVMELATRVRRMACMTDDRVRRACAGRVAHLPGRPVVVAVGAGCY